MSKSKYTYQSYDYSFLDDGTNWASKWYFKFAQKVSAKTIGFDLAEVRPMDEPVGQLFWFDSVAPTDTTDDTTYEPIRDNGMPGGWEVRLTPPVTVTETPLTDASGTYTPHEEKTTETPRYHHHSLYPHYTDIERVRNEKNKAYWKKRNFFKNIRNQRYGKKI